MEIKGFTKIQYDELQAEIKRVYNRDELPEIQIAAKVNLKSVQTVRNAFVPGSQVISDESFSKVLPELGIDLLIVWYQGERCYYIKK